MNLHQLSVVTCQYLRWLRFFGPLRNNDDESDTVAAAERFPQILISRDVSYSFGKRGWTVPSSGPMSVG